MENSMKNLQNSGSPYSLAIDQGMVQPVRSKLRHLKVIPVHLRRGDPVADPQVPWKC